MSIRKLIKSKFFKECDHKKETMEGINEYYDSVVDSSKYFIIFKNNGENEESTEYFLYDKISKKLIVKTIGMEITNPNNDFFSIIYDYKEKYLFKLNGDYIKNNKIDFLILDKNTDFENLKSNKFSTFISKYNSSDRPFYLRHGNEIFYFDEESNIHFVKIPYDEDLSSHNFRVINLGKDIIGINFYDYSTGINLTNVFSFDREEFLFKEFINSTIVEFNVVGEHIYFKCYNNNIYNGKGEKIVNEPFAAKVNFINGIHYAITKRKDRVGLISLLEKKIIFRPILVDIIIENDGFLILESVGGTYRKVNKDGV